MINASAGFKAAADNPQRVSTKKFIFDGTDYSSLLDAIESTDIRMFEGDDIDAAPLTVTLINDDKTFNTIKTTPSASFNRVGAVSAGFDGEFITLYQGKLDGAEFPITDRYRAVLRFVNKFKACIETTLGSVAYPLNYASAAYNPADLIWDLLTTRGGLDSTASTSNTDIDYTRWLEYKASCSVLGFSLRAYFTGQSISEALRLIGVLTDALIYPDPSGKVCCRKFLPRMETSPYLFTENNAHLERPRSWINRDRVINKVKVWYGFNPSTQVWSGSVSPADNTASITAYGPLGREFDNRSVWHDSLASAQAFGNWLIARYPAPAEILEFETRSQGSQAMLSQIGDVISVTCSKQDITARAMQIYGIRFDLWGGGGIVAEDMTAFNSIFFFMQKALPANLYWQAVGWNGSVFCAVAAGGTNLCATSPDGVTWTQRTLPATAFLQTIAALNTGLFVAVAYGSSTYFTSPDGSNWTSRTLPAGLSYMSLASKGNLLVLVANGSSTAYTSSDGINWFARTLPVGAQWYSVAWNGSVFCAIAFNSSICATSPDGINWTQHALPASSFWMSITAKNGLFCAITNQNNICATSPDGTTWTQHTLPSSSYWTSIAANGNVFCAIVGNGSTIAATSPDGVTWTPRTLPTTAGWIGVGTNGNIFVAVAYGSTIAAVTINA